MKIKNHKLKEWLIATRYWSFAVSAAPVIVTLAYLYSNHMVTGDRSALCAFLTLTGVLLLHAAGNVLSDYFDFRKGVDNGSSAAVQNLVSKKFEPCEYLNFSLILFGAGIVTGIVLTVMCGMYVLIIGAAGVVLTAAYSFLKYRALGDLDIFVIFSVLIMLGTSVTVCGTPVWEVLVLALPVGLITVSVLHANNTYDIESDKAAGIRTFAMLIGGKASCILYQAYMIIPFVCVAVAVFSYMLDPFALLCCGAIPAAISNVKSASHFEHRGIRTMKGLDQQSSKMQIIFSGLLSSGLIIGLFL